MFEFCSEKVVALNFICIQGSDLQLQCKRYNGLPTLPGASSFHQFIDLGDNRVGAKRCSIDTNCTKIHKHKKQQDLFQLVILGGYEVVVYNDNWWTSILTEIYQEEGDGKVKFLHPKVHLGILTGLKAMTVLLLTQTY